MHNLMDTMFDGTIFDMNFIDWQLICNLFSDTI